MEVIHLIDLIESYADLIQPGKQFFYRYNISNKQIFGAISTFAKGVNPDAIVGMIDDSLKKDGTEGVLFSTSAMYFSVVDVPGLSVKNAMLRYKDIVSARVITDKLSDFNNTIQIDIQNLPYEYYRLTNITFRKKPLADLLNAIVDSPEADYWIDKKASYDLIKHYLAQKDEVMSDVLSCIEEDNKIDKYLVSITDGFGMTPLHYCIASGDLKNADRIYDATLKKNADLYLRKQPYGIYSFCMNVAMAGHDILEEKEWYSLVFYICQYQEKIIILDKKRKRLETKENLIEFGKEMVNSAIEESQNIEARRQELLEQEAERRSEQIDNYEQMLDKKVREGKITNYSKYVNEKDKIERARQLIAEKTGVSNNEDDNDGYESYYQDDEEYEEKPSVGDITGLLLSKVEDKLAVRTYEDNAQIIDFENMTVDDVKELKFGTSDEVNTMINNVIRDYYKKCVSTVNKLKKSIARNEEDIDPRTSIIIDMFKDINNVKKRLEESRTSPVYLFINYKYFVVSESFLNNYPSLQKFVVDI